MDLYTTYLGLKLNNPFMTGAAPLANNLDRARRLEDAGAGAIVLDSLFQEQLEPPSPAAAEPSFRIKDGEFKTRPAECLEQIRRIKAAVKIPVLASLNGATSSGWVRTAQLLEQAGADALELNIYSLGANPRESGADVEKRVLEVVAAVKSSLKIPLAVKLLPFFSSLAHFALRLEATGANGLVLFNRVYQPTIDAELLEFAAPQIQYTDPAELYLRIHWLAVLSGQVKISLAASGGVYTGLDAAQVIMAGADAVQVVSVLLKNGPEHLSILREELTRWLETHKYNSITQLRGCMNLSHCTDPCGFARSSYMRILQKWR
jgi:dihydroorotate dehydrogenase (fumarate)